LVAYARSAGQVVFSLAAYARSAGILGLLSFLWLVMPGLHVFQASFLPATQCTRICTTSRFGQQTALCVPGQLWRR